MNKSTNEVSRAVGIDGPCPAKIGIDIPIVFGQGQQFARVGIGDVHEYEAAIEIFGQQRSQMTWADPIHGHPVVTSVVTRMNFEGQIVLYCQFTAAGPAPIAQNLALVSGGLIAISQYHW